MKAAGLRRDPDLACRAVPVDYHFRTVLEFDLEDARAFGLHVGIRRARFKSAFQRAQSRAREGLEFAFGHVGT